MARGVARVVASREVAVVVIGAENWRVNGVVAGGLVGARDGGEGERVDRIIVGFVALKVARGVALLGFIGGVAADVA